MRYVMIHYKNESQETLNFNRDAVCRLFVSLLILLKKVCSSSTVATLTELTNKANEANAAN